LFKERELHLEITDDLVGVTTDYAPSEILADDSEAGGV
jgi:hypothetical protein